MDFTDKGVRHFTSAQTEARLKCTHKKQRGLSHLQIYSSSDTRAAIQPLSGTSSLE